MACCPLARWVGMRWRLGEFPPPLRLINQFNFIFCSCRCHLGKSIVYDTVTNLSWAVNIHTHTITAVIDQLLSLPWEYSEKSGREVPEAKTEEDCVVSWPFVAADSVVWEWC